MALGMGWWGVVEVGVRAVVEVGVRAVVEVGVRAVVEVVVETPGAIRRSLHVAHTRSWC
jgi:hypothetical protein